MKRETKLKTTNTVIGGAINTPWRFKYFFFFFGVSQRKHIHVIHISESQLKQQTHNILGHLYVQNPQNKTKNCNLETFTAPEYILRLLFSLVFDVCVCVFYMLEYVNRSDHTMHVRHNLLHCLNEECASSATCICYSFTIHRFTAHSIFCNILLCYICSIFFSFLFFHRSDSNSIE